MYGTSGINNATVIPPQRLQSRQLNPQQQRVQNKITEWKNWLLNSYTDATPLQEDLDAVEKGIMDCVEGETEILFISGSGKKFALGGQPLAMPLPEIGNALQPLNLTFDMIRIHNLKWLKCLPQWINQLTGVKELHVTDCGLEEISGEFFNKNQASLTIFIANGNKLLTCLPSEIGQATKLITCSLFENGIKDEGIPDSIFELTCSIDYEGNPIENAESIEKLEKHNRKAKEHRQNTIIEWDLQAWGQPLIR